MLVFVGLSHDRAPLALRERCAIAAGDRTQTLAHLRERFTHAVLVSTCGRTEVYVDAPDPDAAAPALIAWAAARARVAPEALCEYLHIARGADAVHHVVRVACGLESAIEGEDEVLGQVRRAWLDAAAAGALSPALDEAFRMAVRTGRQARRLGDGHGWTSLADSAVTEVARAVDRHPSPRVLVAGTGPMGLRAAHGLRQQVGRRLDLVLAGRTPTRVEAHAASVGARPVLLPELAAALRDADAAIVALRTRRPLIEAADVGEQPRCRPLLLVDLSVPRAVGDAVAALPGVRLRNVDDLGDGAGAWGRWTVAEREQVDGLAQQAVRCWAAGEQPSDADATLTTLRLRAEGMRRRQLEQTLQRLPDLDPSARWAVDALTRSIVNRLLHDPTMRLRTDQDGTVARMVREVFAMTGGG